MISWVVKGGRLRGSSDECTTTGTSEPPSKGKLMFPKANGQRLVWVFLAIAIGWRVAAADDVTKVALFKPGMGGYPTFRMEALCVTPKGTILAFTEGRKGGSGVNGDVDLVLRRSFDGGKTWKPLQVAIDFGKSTVCYPCPLVDRDTGTIWLAMSQFSGGHQGTMARGETDPSHVWISKSTDDGATWAKPIEITRHVKPKGTTWHAPGAGYGIQLRSGRLVFPCYHFRAGPTDKHRIHESSVFYSDDHGRSWKLGGIVNRYAAETEVDPQTPFTKRVQTRRGWMIPGRTDEAQVVQLDDGRLLMNMRSYHSAYRRAISHSDDGGLTWSPVSLARELIEPVCSGSIARYSSVKDGDHRSRILFANPSPKAERQTYNGHGMRRENLTLRVSYDEGQSWPVSRVLDPGPTGNLNMLTLPDGRIAVLYESGPQIFRETVYFATCTLDWLTNGKEPPHSRR